MVLPAFDAASLAVSPAFFADFEAVFAADLAPPVMLSAISRNLALALSNVPVGFCELGIFFPPRLIWVKSTASRFVPPVSGRAAR